MVSLSKYPVENLVRPSIALLVGVTRTFTCFSLASLSPAMMQAPGTPGNDSVWAIQHQNQTR
jgi:hypothetical protein